MRSLIAVVIFALASGCAQVTPSHDIPVKEEYIEAGIQAGDTIELVLNDGTEMSFEVVSLSSNAINSPDGPVEFAEIQSISKRSWDTPGHPCGANEPVGCSIPDVVLLLSDEYSEQAKKFHPACVTHDFCYRHGHATYGVGRKECDDKFLRSMKDSCGGFAGLDFLDPKQFSICRTAAEQTYNAVRLKGEPHFRINNSSYCEYRPDP